MDYDYLYEDLQRHLKDEEALFHIAHELAYELKAGKRDRQAILDEAQSMGIDNDALIELASRCVLPSDQSEAS